MVADGAAGQGGDWVPGASARGEDRRSPENAQAVPEAAQFCDVRAAAHFADCAGTHRRRRDESGTDPIPCGGEYLIGILYWLNSHQNVLRCRYTVT